MLYHKCGKCGTEIMPLTVIDGMVLCNPCHLEMTHLIEKWYDEKKTKMRHRKHGHCKGCQELSDMGLGRDAIANIHRATLVELMPKGKCTKCGQFRVIEFVCLYGMDDAHEPVTKRELCKKCTTNKNKCRHFVCRANYRDRLDP
jgi:hypothetical protein